MFFTRQKIGKQLVEIKQAIYREVREIEQFRFREGEQENAHLPDFDDSAWEDFHLMDYWGGYDVVAWFRATVKIPVDWCDEKVYLRFLVGPRDGGESTAETLLYVNGEPLQGIDIWHEEAWLSPDLLQQGEIDIALKAWSGVLGVPDRRRFKVAQLIRIDEPTEKFFHLSDTLRQALHELDKNDLRHATLLTLLDKAFRMLDFAQFRSEAFYESVAAAYAFLAREIDRFAQQPELKPTVYGVGHAHIDMAWLWRLSHSREKAARTFATVLHLMRQYPEYRFIHSSPHLYKMLKEDYPDLFERVKIRIQTGEWEITGGMWIESDTNVPNGESLIRQFLLGKRYMREEFGVDCDLLWLPDVFGYSWALPQIAKGSGMRYFLTSKISWSQYNRFPHDTFLWRGIDGTELLTHFITTPEEGSPFYTYNGQARPKDILGTWNNYRQKDKNDELLTLFGWGDGGGGPTKEMLESGRTLENLPGFPRFEQIVPSTYFERLTARLADETLPIWDGELYLEYHRGTYTSQAQVKRANRKAEVLYHHAEWLATMRNVLLDGAHYPHAELHEGWEWLLLNQFHDILPGSSIREVYEDTERDYAKIFALGEAALQKAQDDLVARVQSENGGWLVQNGLSWKRGGLIEVEGDVDNGQISAENTTLLPVTAIPSLGYSVVNETTLPKNSMTITPTLLENRFVRIELNERGQIVSLQDKRNGREVLAGRGNVLQTFIDKPMAFDAWDIDIYYQDVSTEIDTLTTVTVSEIGPLRGTLTLQWQYYDSTITQQITLYDHTPRIDFRTEVDWQEKQILLKVAFPVNVRNTRATYDIQFGQIERPTHWNTSWDLARFEVSAHKWADLSEGDYGVALLNDCKYGYDIKDNVMRLTLIKSSVRPDALADKGQHAFTYSLFPHSGDWRNVVREGYDLNYPLLATPLVANLDGDLPTAFSFASADNPNVIIETVKRAEDSDGWIVRVYETMQTRGEVTLSFGQPLKAAWSCNLVEDDVEAIAFEDNVIAFTLNPYQIQTFKVQF